MGVIVGVFIGLVYICFKIDVLFFGILVMMGLYFINLSVFGCLNIFLFNVEIIFKVLFIFDK